jgi:hypothetical protein
LLRAITGPESVWVLQDLGWPYGFNTFSISGERRTIFGELSFERGARRAGEILQAPRIQR